jgi:hypothetical protein
MMTRHLIDPAQRAPVIDTMKTSGAAGIDATMLPAPDDSGG